MDMFDGAVVGENWDRDYIPFAFDEGGNYFCFRVSQDDAVFFWDHEEHEPWTYLAKGFDEFIDRIEPFDMAAFLAEHRKKFDNS